MVIAKFIAMGGYSMYVWPSYGITLAVLGFNLWLTTREQAQVKKRIYHYLQSKNTSL